jgi:hypothetical protein
MDDILHKLAGHDRRSIGRVNEVVEDVLHDPTLFEVVFNGMLSHDPVIRMRCADAVEKITVQHPGYVQPFKTKLIHQVARSGQQEVRWHVAQMVPRLDLNAEERELVVAILLDYLSDRSKIVKTFSMQALADLAGEDAHLRERLIPLFKELTETGSPAVKSRGRKLLTKLRSPTTTTR